MNKVSSLFDRVFFTTGSQKKCQFLDNLDKFSIQIQKFYYIRVTFMSNTELSLTPNFFEDKNRDIQS